MYFYTSKKHPKHIPPSYARIMDNKKHFLEKKVEKIAKKAVFLKKCLAEISVSEISGVARGRHSLTKS